MREIWEMVKKPVAKKKAAKKEASPVIGKPFKLGQSGNPTGRPKGVTTLKLDAIGIDEICTQISSAKSLTAIADEIEVAISTLVQWIAADPERSARARTARAMTAQLWDEKAETGIEDAKAPFDLLRAKELAHHYRWRAAKIDPKRYGDKLAVGGDAEAPPISVESKITLTAEEAYKRMLNGDT